MESRDRFLSEDIRIGSIISGVIVFSGVLHPFQGIIKPGIGQLHIWSHIGADEGDDAEDDPSEEAQIQREQFTLVSFHHPLALLDALCGSQLRVFQQQKETHSVPVQSNDPRDDKKEGPEENVDGHLQIHDQCPTGHGKTVQQIVVGCVFPLIQCVQYEDHKTDMKDDQKNPNGDVDENGTCGWIVVLDRVLEKRHIHGLQGIGILLNIHLNSGKAGRKIG